jgi:hypothetical protein
MWLTLARESATAVEDAWIRDMQEKASRQATDDERQMAVLYLERYLKARRD